MIEFQPPIRALRIFDVTKAKEFYIDYLGSKSTGSIASKEVFRSICKFVGAALCCTFPSIMASPDAVVYVRTSGLREYHAELKAKKYNYLRPGINEDAPGDARELSLNDLFGNRIRFVERK